jgi:hypothetical protein
MDVIFGDTAAYEENQSINQVQAQLGGVEEDLKKQSPRGGRAGLTSGNDPTSGLAGVRGRRGVCGSWSSKGYMGLGKPMVEQYVVSLGR